VLARTPDLLNLAGAVEVPAEKRGAAWDEVRRRTRAARDTRLLAEAETSGVNAVASFDKSIDRVPTVRRVEP
jgi:predicted nucleic acid-binding protein